MLKINQLNKNVRNKVVDRKNLLWIIDQTFKIKYSDLARTPAEFWREIPKRIDFLNDKSFNEYNNFITDKISFNTLRNQIDNFQGNIGRFYDRIHKMFQNCRDFNNSEEDKQLHDLSIRLQNDIIKIIEDKFNSDGLNKRKRECSIDKEKQIDTINHKPKILKSVDNSSFHNHVLFQSYSPNSIIIDNFEIIESNQINDESNVQITSSKKIESHDKIKVKTYSKIGILSKLRKIIKNKIAITDDNIKIKFNDFLLRNNYDLDNLYYNFTNTKNADMIKELKNIILSIDYFFDNLIKENKQKVVIEKEVNNCLQSIISTLEYPEKIKVINKTINVKKNIQENTKALSILKKNYEGLTKKKNKIENDISNFKYESGRMRNDIFKLTEKYDKEHSQYEILKNRNSAIAKAISKLNMENSKFMKKEKELETKTKQNNNHKENVKATEELISVITIENKSKSKEFKLLSKKLQELQQKNQDFVNKIFNINSCDLPMIEKQLKEHEDIFKELDKKYKESQIELNEKNENLEKESLRLNEMLKKIKKSNEILEKESLRLKSKNVDQYNKYKSLRHDIIEFRKYLSEQDTICKKLDDFKEHKLRKEINCSSSSSEIEIVNSMNIPDRCKICAKHYKDYDFSGMCVAFPCGHSGICLSCVNRGYKNKCDDGKYDKCFMRNCCTVKCVYTKVIL
jgi:hypothetical protein